jgi:23S rRNA (uracil1939-C5)-methyltransferase
MSRLPRTPLETTVDGFTHGGDGVARVDGKAVFVPGALPGERIRIRVVEDRRRWARADLLDVVVPADERVTPPCPHAADCGGCDLQHVTPTGQLALKTRVVREQLERIGRLDDPPVEDCLAVGPALGYRSLARLHGDTAGRLGFHRHRSTEVVPIDRCPVLTPGAQSVRDDLGDRPGVVTAAVHATSTGDRAIVVTTDAGAPDLADLPPDLEVVVRTGAEDRPGRRAVRGMGTVTERVTGLDFTVSAGGFFQANVAGAAALVDAVLTDVAIALSIAGPLATPGDGHHGDGGHDAATPVPPGVLAGITAWDLYAGVGLFSLPLARAGAHVVAVEVVGDAVAHLGANAARAGLAARVPGITGDVGRVLVDGIAHPDVSAAAPDVVVLDPPRTGAGPDVVAALAEHAPAGIVYVACDPAALARDARALAAAGYRLERARPFDLFPMTHHVEVVARFARFDRTATAGHP